MTILICIVIMVSDRIVNIVELKSEEADNTNLF